MPSTEKRDVRLEWVCRIFMTIDVFAISGGYITYFQLKHQLASPLIPKSAIDQVMSDTHIMEASIVCAIRSWQGFGFIFFKENWRPLFFSFWQCCLSNSYTSWFKEPILHMRFSARYMRGCRLHSSPPPFPFHTILLRILYRLFSPITSLNDNSYQCTLAHV
jgi:hypothetical protein